MTTEPFGFLSVAVAIATLREWDFDAVRYITNQASFDTWNPLFSANFGVWSFRIETPKSEIIRIEENGRLLSG